MSLIHHVVPLAVRQRVVVLIRKIGVRLKQGLRLRGQIVGAGASLRRIQMILAHGDVKLRHDLRGFRRMLHQFEKSVALALRQLPGNFFCLRRNRLEFVEHALCFLIIHEAESFRIE